MAEVKIPNPWDVQSKRIHQIDGITTSIYSGERSWGGGEIYIMIQKEKPKIKFIAAIEGNGARPSHRGCGFSESDTSYTLNSVEVHGVAYELSKDNRDIDGE